MHRIWHTGGIRGEMERSGKIGGGGTTENGTLLCRLSAEMCEVKRHYGRLGE